MVFILIFSLIYFQTVDIKPARDSAIQQILEGKWENAIDNAKFVLTHKPDDPLLLGLLKFGHVKGFVSKLNPKFWYLLSEKKSDIVKTWEKFYKENREKQDLPQILAILYLDVDIEKTKLYCNKMLELDSLSNFTYFLLGYASEMEENCDEAIIYYRKSFELDTTVTDCLSKLAELYLLTGNYDSALVYFRQIPYGDSICNTMHIGEIICELKMKNIAEAETTLNKLKDLGMILFTTNSIVEIQEYIDAVKESRLSPEDSLSVFWPIFLKQVNLSPTILGLLLIENEINIINFSSRATKLGIRPYFAVEVKPKPIHIPQPKYPEKAIKEKFEGSVIVKALVDTDGSIAVAEILISSGNEVLDAAALKTAEKAKFEPAIQFGKPVRVWVSIPIRFRLN